MAYKGPAFGSKEGIALGAISTEPTTTPTTDEFWAAIGPIFGLVLAIIIIWNVVALCAEPVFHFVWPAVVMLGRGVGG